MYIKCDFECKMEYGINLIKGKWKPTIICTIKEFEKIRYNSLHREIEDISHKVLSQKLKELENDNVICKKTYDDKIPKVEYTLTKRGETLHEILKAFINLVD